LKGDSAVSMSEARSLAYESTDELDHDNKLKELPHMGMADQFIDAIVSRHDYAQAHIGSSELSVSLVRHSQHLLDQSQSLQTRQVSSIRPVPSSLVEVGSLR